MISTMGEQPYDPVAFFEPHKKWHIYSAFYIESLQAGFCDFMNYTKTIGLPLYLFPENSFSHKKLHISHKKKLEFQRKK